MCCIQVRPAGSRKFVSAHQTVGRLLLLCERSARAQAGPRQLLRPDGFGHDRRYNVSARHTYDRTNESIVFIFIIYSGTY